VKTAIILAGGLGTRLRPVVSEVPKPMALVNGRPFLAYLMDYWIEQGISQFILSVGYLKEVIIEYFGNSYHGADINYVVEETPLGTGGGVLLAAKNLAAEEYFVLLNGDTFFNVDLSLLFACAMKSDADGCFALFRATEPDRYGRIDCDELGKIKQLNLTKAESGDLANGGIYILRRSALLEEQAKPGQKISLEDEIFPAALAAGRKLFGLEFSSAFIDIGVPADYQRASHVLGGSRV
jgi:D-glycero-alpha-D-manno-heptose 1-phosphate guanylyltransferase